MRAKGKDKVKPWKGGNDKQRKHLDAMAEDHNDLHQDVADLERRLNNILAGNEKRLIVVDIGEESEEVTFRYFDALGTDGGEVEP